MSEKNWQELLKNIQNIAAEITKSSVEAFTNKDKEALNELSNEVYQIECELDYTSQRARKLRKSLAALDLE